MADQLKPKHERILEKAAAVIRARCHEGDARLADSVEGVLASLRQQSARRTAPSSLVGDDGLPVSDNVDTPEFREMLDEFAYRASERRAMGGDFGTAEAEEVAETQLIAHIDAWAARRQRKLREAWEDDDKACVGAYAEENGRLKEELRAARRAAGSTAGVPNYGVLPILDERKHAVEAFDADYKATTMGEWEWGLFLAGWLARSTLHARLATFAEQPQETE